MTTKETVPKSTQSKRNPLTSACPTTSAMRPTRRRFCSRYIASSSASSWAPTTPSQPRSSPNSPPSTTARYRWAWSRRRGIWALPWLQSRGAQAQGQLCGGVLEGIRRTHRIFGDSHVVPGRSHVRHLHVRSADYDHLRPGRREERNLGRERLEPVLPSGVPACHVLAKFHGKATASHPVAVPHSRGPVGVRAVPHRALPPAARMQKTTRAPFSR